MALVRSIFTALLANAAVFGVMILAGAGTYGLSSGPNTSPTVSDVLIKRLADERIIAIRRWRVESGELICVFRAFQNDPLYEGSGVKLTIFDPSGTSLYEDRFTGFRRVYQTSALRNGSSELAIEVHYGATTHSLRMLAFRDGKIVDLLDETESDFEVGAEVRPQFRSGVSSATEPFQIMLTRGVGLASSAKKYTSIFRYKDGKYQRIGDVSQRDIDNYIEEHLRSSVSKRSAN